jgi:hypothetical protein
MTVREEFAKQLETSKPSDKRSTSKGIFGNYIEAGEHHLFFMLHKTPSLLNNVQTDMVEMEVVSVGLSELERLEKEFKVVRQTISIFPELIRK